MSQILTEYIPHLHESKYTIHHRQDCDPVLESVKRLKDELSRHGGSDSFKVAAQIPMVILWQWGKEDNINYFGHLDKAQSLKLLKRLNDPEFKKFRVWEGRLGKEDVR